MLTFLQRTCLRNVGIVLVFLSVLAAPRLLLAQTPAPSGEPIASPAATSEPEYWIGRILVPNPGCPEITFVVTLTARGAGWDGKFSISPGCSVTGMFDVTLSEVSRTAESIRFVTPPPPAENVYELTLDASGSAGSGRLLLNRLQDIPIRIQRATRADAMNIAPKRPQMPVEPFPYENREIVVTNPTGLGGGPVRLSGVVSIPTSAALASADGKRPAVVLIADENPHDRDHTEGLHKPGLVMADLLARQGVIVARFDDRGVGLSEGSYLSATLAESASDAQAIIAFLQAMPEVDQKRVGIIGRGEGASVAAQAAAEDPEMTLLVLMAPSARPWKEVMIAKERRQFEAQGEDPAYIQARVTRYSNILTLATQPDKVDAMRKAILDDIEAQARTGRAPNAMNQFQVDDLIDVRTDYLSQARHIDRLVVNPRAFLEKVSCPVLILTAELDYSVPPADTLPGVLEALKVAKNASVTARSFPATNHVFQPCNTGFEDEYNRIETTISPEVIAVIVEWLAKLPR